MTDAEASLSSRLSRLTPFSRSRRKEDDEDKGEEIDYSSIAGGGHSARRTELTKHRLRVSHALKSLLVAKRVLSEEEAGVASEQQTEALHSLLNKSHIYVPPELTDRSHPLPEYFVSSSHNTYLLAHQLYGSSSAAAYETALNTGSRCVEIDAWDNEENREEPKVTHGYTLVSNIPFRAVCETIRDVVDKEAREAEENANEQGYRAAPILLSLENHCDAQGQLRLVQIMKEVWGDRLLSSAVRQKGHEEQEGADKHVTLAELGSKIVVIVEYHFPGEQEDSSDSCDSSDSSFDEGEREAEATYKQKKKTAPPSIIIPELAEIGVYAQSVKPADNSWFEESSLRNGPHHHLINVSEAGLGAHLPQSSSYISRHNAHHLMRVYPKGTRISSKNLKPVPFWGIGAQICALNWQTFGASMQINEALFSGSDGYVLKPLALRSNGNGKLNTGRIKKLRLHIAGATDVPVPEGREADIKPYITCSLYHPDDLADEPPKRKTNAYKQHKLNFLHKGESPPPTDPIWDDVLEWEYEENELTFLRILVKSDDRFVTNPKLAIAAVRLSYVVPEWRFVRMLDLKGRETTCSLLVRFEIIDA